uniref:Rpn family recombination-promoting nuclease/putative transposase n=1 Tax=Prevotella sp. TaxID=59823 RepID=UPI004028328E
MGKYINPFTDWGFKRLFGQEFSKDLLISFLNDLLEGELHVKDVTFTDKLRFIYLSLPLFDKKVEECETDFDKWIYVLKHMATLERIPFATQKKIFKRLADIADSRCLSKEEMKKYEESQRVVDNYNLGMYSAWYQGNEEGIEKGIEKGKIDTQIATAKNFLAMKLTLEQVAAGTGLSLEEVLALMKKQ